MTETKHSQITPLFQRALTGELDHLEGDDIFSNNLTRAKLAADKAKQGLPVVKHRNGKIDLGILLDDPGSREFVCPYCQHSFAYKSVLGRHVKSIHEKHLVAKHTCPLCPFSTVWKEQLFSHFTIIHQDYKPYICSVCSFRAGKPCRVTSHILKAHDGKGKWIHDSKAKPRDLNNLILKKRNHKDGPPMPTNSDTQIFSLNSEVPKSFEAVRIQPTQSVIDQPRSIEEIREGEVVKTRAGKQIKQLEERAAENFEKILESYKPILDEIFSSNDDMESDIQPSKLSTNKKEPDDFVDVCESDGDAIEVIVDSDDDIDVDVIVPPQRVVTSRMFHCPFCDFESASQLGMGEHVIKLHEK